MRRDFFFGVSLKRVKFYHKNALHRFYKLVIEKSWRMYAMAVTLYS